MTLAEIIGEFRRIAFDMVKPYAVSDVSAISFANRAEDEASIRAKLLHDTVSEDLVLGSSFYSITGGFFEIEDNAVLTDADGVKSTVRLTDRETLERIYGEWRLLGNAKPKYAVFENGKIEVFPTPDKAYTLALFGYRTPLSAMESMGDEPEIISVHHDGLADWMAKLAFISVDSDINAPVLAKECEQRFITRFGDREDANVLRKHAKKGSHTIRAI